MRKTVLILGSAALASLFTLAHGQAPAPRAADAPPLVALTPERDGNFRIAPPYVDDPAFTEKAGVSKGTVHRFTMNSADSKIYPTAPGAQDAPPAPFDRTIAVYIPPGYVRGRETPFIVVQDERWYVKEDAPNGRTDLAFMPVMLDNLIAEKRIPSMVAVMLWPGPGHSITATIAGTRFSAIRLSSITGMKARSVRPVGASSGTYQRSSCTTMKGVSRPRT